jgi:hypothetical protein
MKAKLLVKDCEITPRFYLPVDYDICRRKKVCYPFPLAPFVLFWSINTHVFRIIWSDLLHFVDDLKKRKD